ncbi:hypothetical protein PQH03_07050 [Ralstonia insidiosa]|uniref:hypothetical protein n=1 Tax=Ralstonia insidiosa TaxID=190721 RepID=UPI0020628120|nr:hypothetical protein [Ralstonia insidiosa]MDE4924383.1 hypothetical protein [Ralstonia insidiosa]UNJ99927.1 hypothetical protein MMB19_14495 [Ralstonia insidiosa]
MNNSERERYPALSQAQIRAIYHAYPTPAVRRLVWEIYCLHVVAKTAGAVVRARGMQHLMPPGGFDMVLDELARVLKPETYIHENFPPMHAIHEKRKAASSTKKRNKKAYR